jgi:hypothetical protein
MNAIQPFQLPAEHLQQELAQEFEFQVVFEDNFKPNAFSTPTGLDAATWAFDVGDRDMSDPSNPGPERWGNGEPQWYTDRRALCSATYQFAVFVRTVFVQGSKQGTTTTAAAGEETSQNIEFMLQLPFSCFSRPQIL